MSAFRQTIAVLLLLALVLAGCGTDDTATEPALAEVSLPDLSRADEAVRNQAQERYGNATERGEPSRTPWTAADPPHPDAG